jgi:nucleoside-diphosphate-sugar epimerase
MKYFITGAHGFIGKNLTTKLINSGHDVTVYDRVRPASIPEGTAHVIHLAAEIHNETVMYDVNVNLTHELLESARAITGLKSFIYVGSSSEYGAKTAAMKESDILEPRTMYEATKGMGTLLTQMYARKFLVPAAIVRPFSVYGPEENSSRLIPTLLRAAITKEILKISPGTHDFIYIDDFVNGLLAVQDHLIAADIVNIGTGIETTNEEALKLVEKVTGNEILYTTTDIKLRSYDSDCWCADISKLRTSYGFVPEYSLEHGLTAFWRNINGN